METQEIRQKVWRERDKLAAELGITPSVKAILSRVPECADTNEVRYHLAFSRGFETPSCVAQPDRYLRPVTALATRLGRLPRRVDIYDAGLAENPEIASLARRMAEAYIPDPSTPLGKSITLAHRWALIFRKPITAEVVAFCLECSVEQASEYLSQLNARGLHNATA